MVDIEGDEPVPKDCQVRSEASQEAPGWFDEDLRWALSFWHEARNGGALPVKSRIDPLRFPPRCLEMAFLFELRGEEWYARLIGTGYFALYGQDVTGRRVSDFIRETGSGPRVLVDYATARSQRVPVFSRSILNWRPIGGQLPYHRIVLPFAADAEAAEVRYLLGFTKLFGLP